MTRAELKTLWRRFLGFCGVGGAMTLLSMLLVFVGNEWLNLNRQLVYAAAYLLTLLLSYILNSKLVFHSAFRWRDLAGYVGTYISGMLLGMALLWLLGSVFPHGNATVLSYAVIPATMVWNFFFVNKILAK